MYHTHVLWYSYILCCRYDSVIFAVCMSQSCHAPAICDIPSLFSLLRFLFCFSRLTTLQVERKVDWSAGGLSNKTCGIMLYPQDNIGHTTDY